MTKKAGRPKKSIDWVLVDSLAKLEASEAYIAECLLNNEKAEINSKSLVAKVKLLQRKIQERYQCNFVRYKEQKLEARKISLRQWQWKAAEKGNVSMLIWLGKQYLGQTDKAKEEDSNNSKFQLTPEQLALFMSNLVTNKPADLQNGNTTATTDNSQSAGE
jgi:hypothetical protein